MKIRTPLCTSGGILDEVILRAYENYSRKPQALTLEQWLYQTTNEVLEFAQFGWERREKWECSAGPAVQNCYKTKSGAVSY